MEYAAPLVVGSTTTRCRTDQSRVVLAKYSLLERILATYETHDVPDSTLNMEALDTLYPDKIPLGSKLGEENEGSVSLHNFSNFIQPAKEYTIDLGW